MVGPVQKQLTLLIVEDEIFVALDIEEAVDAAGHRVGGIAVDRVEALAAAPRCDFALIDINLRDGRTGPTIAAELFERFGIRSVFVTANPLQIGSAPNGALGYIRKPFDSKMLAAAIEWVVGDGHSPADNDIIMPLPAQKFG